MLGNLTPKQKKIYDYVLDYCSKNTYSPSLKEIANHFEKSVPTIHQYIKALIKKGFLKKKKGAARGLEITIKDESSANPIIKNLRIGIIGYGIVGQAVEYGFSNQKIYVYDKYKKTDSLELVVKRSDYLFICLPTPTKKDESCIDLTIINDNIAKIAKLASGSDKIIIIKSTVIPGTTSDFIKQYPKVQFCFNPEFTKERSFLQDFINTDRVILGAENDLVSRRVASIYQSIMPSTPIFQTDPTTAEMVKYMANCFLATKVIFANEMYEICRKLGLKYEEVKNMVVADKRIHNSHLDITSLKGFGGKCFPKDLLALRGLANKMKVDAKILDSVWNKNLKIRKVKDWEDIPFAVSKSFGHKR